MMTHEVSHFDDDFTSTRRLLEINRHLKTCEVVAHRQHNSYLQVSVYPKTVQNLQTNYQTKLTSV